MVGNKSSFSLCSKFFFSFRSFLVLVFDDCLMWKDYHAIVWPCTCVYDSLMFCKGKNVASGVEAFWNRIRFKNVRDKIIKNYSKSALHVQTIARFKIKFLREIAISLNVDNKRTPTQTQVTLNWMKSFEKTIIKSTVLFNSIILRTLT